MTRLADIVTKVRSKNAGPFWLTIDIFCGSEEAFERACTALSSDGVAAILQCPPDELKRFEISDLNVIKFSLPRPQVQGAIDDRDMHGASWAALIGDIDIA